MKLTKNLNLKENMKTFKQYHQENPLIYQEYKKVAYNLINRGYKRLSSKFIFEIVRYNTNVSGNDGFKINNIYTADYARMFEHDHPQFLGYFSKRLVKFKEV